MSAALLLLGLGGLYAQKAVLTAGSDATGTGGSISYSIGQPIYKSALGPSAYTSEGVQQPYEISTLTGAELTGIDLSMGVYPNPTTDRLALKIDGTDLNGFGYHLSDFTGKSIEAGLVLSAETVISMKGMPSACYFLTVTHNQEFIKTFKIIKQ